MDKTLLKQKIVEWNSACDFFQKQDVQMLLSNDEKEAITFLCNFWKNKDFDKEACERQIEILKRNDVNHAPHREVIEKSKSLRGIAITFYTKDASLYDEFRIELGRSHEPETIPITDTAPKSVIDEVLIMNFVEKWSKAIQFLKSESVVPFLEANELTAIELLADMWRRPSFQVMMKEEAMEMVEVLVSSHKMHSSNREIIEQSKNLCGVARKVYGDEISFNAFKKAITKYYKEHKPPRRIPKPSPVFPQKDKKIIVEDVLFANGTKKGDVIKEFSKILYHNTLFIVPKLIISSNYFGNEEIEVILGYPNGKTESYRTNIIFEGKGTYVLTGWGSENGTSYMTYDRVFYTFKNKNEILWQGSVTIQKNPQSAERPIIKNVQFCATDTQGKIVVPYASTIPTGIAYLNPRITVDNNFYGAVTLDIEYESEKRGKVYTKSDVIINGPGEYTLIGWGRDDCTYYSEPDLISCTLRYSGTFLCCATVQIGNYKKRKRSSGKNKIGISDIGLWFYEKYERPDEIISMMSLLLFVVYGIIVVATWIKDSFFNALITGVVGLFVVGLMYWVIEKVTKILFFVFSIVFLNVWTLLVTIGVIGTIIIL